jgi:hypothetical protein
MQRDLGGILPSQLAANVIDWCHAISVEIPTVGTVRMTDRVNSFTASVDGSPQLWTATDVKVGNLDQGRQTAMSVSYLSIANLDYVWTTWGNVPGLRDAVVHIWEVWFDSTGVYAGAVLKYEGQIDSHSLGLFSTHVEMNRLRNGDDLPWGSVLHARGDEPPPEVSA